MTPNFHILEAEDGLLLQLSLRDGLLVNHLHELSQCWQ